MSSDHTRGFKRFFAVLLGVSTLLFSAPLRGEALRVVGDEAYPPLAFLDEARKPSGYDVDLMTLLGQVLGVPVSLDLLPWSLARQLFEQGSADVLLGCNITPERERRFLFTDSHFENHLVLFAPSSSCLKGIEDLFGRRVGVARNTTAEDFLHQRYPELRLWSFASQPEALQALLRGDVDAVIGDAATGKWWILESGASHKIKVFSTPLHRKLYAMAVSKDRQDLLTKLNEGLQILRERGDLRRLREIWFRETSLLQSLRHPYVLWSILGITALLAMALGGALVMSWRVRAATRAEKILNQRLREEMLERRRAEKQLRDNEIFLSSIVENIPSGIFVKDLLTNTYILTNQATEDIFGIPRSEILRKTPFQVFGREQEKLFRQQDAATLSKNGAVRHPEFQLRTAHAGMRWFSCIKIPLTLNEDKQTHILEIIDDITERKEIQDKLRWTSFHDGLTRLYNRSYFQEEMERLSSGRHDPVGMIICDVDGMKLINDTLGHAAGDEALRSTANILRQTFRKEDVVARIGGDEFAVLLPDIPHQLLEERRKGIMNFLEQENRKERAFPLFLSIGIALRHSAEMSMEELFHRADENMYSQKLRYRESRMEILRASMLARGIMPPENPEDPLEEKP